MLRLRYREKRSGLRRLEVLHQRNPRARWRGTGSHWNWDTGHGQFRSRAVFRALHKRALFKLKIWVATTNFSQISVCNMKENFCGVLRTWENVPNLVRIDIVWVSLGVFTWGKVSKVIMVHVRGKRYFHVVQLLLCHWKAARTKR